MSDHSDRLSNNAADARPNVYLGLCNETQNGRRSCASSVQEDRRSDETITDYMKLVYGNQDYSKKSHVMVPHFILR